MAEVRMTEKDGRTKKRWFMLLLLFILTAINYLDRTNMAVAAPSMSADLGFDAAAMGFLFSAFSWSYGLMQIPGGWFLERFGSRISYTLSLFFWSAFTVVMGFGRNFASLFGIRLAIGAAEAPAFPTNSRVVAAWFPDKERATATSVYTAGEFIGLAFLTPVLFWILENYGWQEIFYVTGFIGVIVSVIWYRAYRDPGECKEVSRAELDYIREGGGLAEKARAAQHISRAQAAELFKHRQLIRQYEHHVFFPHVVPDVPYCCKTNAYAESRDLCGHSLYGRALRRAPRRLVVRSYAEAGRVPVEGSENAGYMRSSLLHDDYDGQLCRFFSCGNRDYGNRLFRAGDGGHHLEYSRRHGSGRFCRTCRRRVQLCR